MQLARPAALAVLLVSLTAAGCRHEDEPTLPVSALPRLVLQPGDVPAGLERFDDGRQARADQPGGVRAAPDRFGRLGGWKARYRGRDRNGILVLESRADLFEDDGGAADELAAAETSAQGEIEELAIGDGGVVAATSQAGFPRPVQVVVVSWRVRNVVAAVTVNGFRVAATRAEAVRLARRQQARIVRVVTTTASA